MDEVAEMLKHGHVRALSFARNFNGKTEEEEEEDRSGLVKAKERAAGEARGREMAAAKAIALTSGVL